MQNTKVKNFVHLNVHSEFSLKDSLVRIPDLIKNVKEKDMPAVAISDNCNLYGCIKLYKKAIDSGLKPIIAMEINIKDGDQVGKMILIAQNNIGYRHLTELISDSYEHATFQTDRNPIILFEELVKKADGLIALSGARKGNIGKNILTHNIDDAREIAKKYKKVFHDKFYLELQRTNHPDDNRHVVGAVNIAAELDIPVVATNPVEFISPDEYSTHEVRNAIAQKMTVLDARAEMPYAFSRHQYLKSPNEMHEIFSDIPSALQNTIEIARQCNIEITLGKNFLPAFPDSQKVGMSEADYLQQEARKGLDVRLAKLYDINDPDFPKIREKYYKRLEYELDIVISMKFPGYFLIVAEFIQWSKDNNIPVGPGRGSGAGSLVAYALRITELDPLKYNLLFERFLNPERVSMPDFDVDFCMDRRDEVIKHTADKYGHDAVSQISTFGTMAAKMVVKDVARALGYPYAVGEKISKLIPQKPGTKLQDAINESADFQFALENESDVKAVIEHSLRLEGITRQTGKHAGGVVIAPAGGLTKFTATYNEISKEGEVINKVSQFDKYDVEDAGLVKFDYLGLKTLTIIQNAVTDINIRREKEGKQDLDILSIPLDDHDVYKMLQEGKTTAVFQVESQGMKELLKSLKPDCFEDCIALVALYRPGPLESGMVENFVNRKHGREKISYPDATYQHSSLKDILEPTYGVILYQEQVMQIAQVLAGYSLGQADMLRRAMGKKKPEEMAKQRSVFKQGAIKNGVDGKLAMKIFDLVEKFAGYGFNKSHSAAYALIAYQTAWLKKHYPSEFMAAVLSGDMDNMDKIVTYIDECRNIGINILPPNINCSKKSFSPKNEKEILYGIGAIKGLGDSAIYSILEERSKNGKYKNLYDFCMRCRSKKTMLEASIFAGALDDLGPSRASMFATYPAAIKIGKQASDKKKEKDQFDMFGSLLEDETIVEYAEAEDWTDKYRLAGERKTLGLYLTGHPINFYEDELKSVISGKLINLMGSDLESGNDEVSDEGSGSEELDTARQVKWIDKKVTIAGLIMDMEIRTQKNGKGQTAFLKIDDKSRQIDVMVFNKTLHHCQHALQVDKTVVIEGFLKMDNRTKKVRLFVSDIKSIDMIRERYADSIYLNFNPKELSKESASALRKLIKEQPVGYASVIAKIKEGETEKELLLNDARITISDYFIEQLQCILGKDAVSVIYRNSNAEKQTSQEKIEQLAKEIITKKEEGQRTFSQRRNEIVALLETAELAMM